MKPSHILRNLLLIAGIVAGSADAATIAGNLGLSNPTGAATNGNLTRQYSSSFVGAGDALGATIDLTFTLQFSVGSGANLSTAFGDGGSIFRKPATTNVGIGESFTITLDSIAINSGWTLDSVAKTDTVSVVSEATKTTRFSVNGGTSFDFTPTGSGVAQRNFVDSRFTAFNSVGNTLSFLNVDQTANGGQNLRNVGFSFEVSAIPEPSTALLGGLGMLARVAAPPSRLITPAACYAIFPIKLPTLELRGGSVFVTQSLHDPYES